MPREIPVFTRKDVTLCQVVATLTEHLPPAKRAGHLRERLLDLARRIEATEPPLPFVREPVPLEALDMTPDDIPA